MKIVWDERKRLTNIREHGYDFAELGDLDGLSAKGEAFFSGATFTPAKLGREMATNEFENKIVTAVFKLLGSEAISLISMRRADSMERRHHAKNKSA